MDVKNIKIQLEGMIDDENKKTLGRILADAWAIDLYIMKRVKTYPLTQNESFVK